jgi:hypothetical protein
MVVWLAWTGSGAQTVVLHGLTNVTIGSTIYGSNYYGKNIFYNLTNANDGVSIHLGEADSGVFVYPVTDGDPPPGSFMAGEVYGSVNGEMDRLICKMRCHEEQDGIHPVQIDHKLRDEEVVRVFQSIWFRGLRGNAPHLGRLHLALNNLELSNPRPFADHSRPAS